MLALCGSRRPPITLASCNRIGVEQDSNLHILGLRPQRLPVIYLPINMAGQVGLEPTPHDFGDRLLFIRAIVL